LNDKGACSLLKESVPCGHHEKKFFDFNNAIYMEQDHLIDQLALYVIQDMRVALLLSVKDNILLLQHTFLLRLLFFFNNCYKILVV
jgi:hypothetical protein